MADSASSTEAHHDCRQTCSWPRLWRICALLIVPALVLVRAPNSTMAQIGPPIARTAQVQQTGPTQPPPPTGGTAPIPAPAARPVSPRYSLNQSGAVPSAVPGGAIPVTQTIVRASRSETLPLPTVVAAPQQNLAPAPVVRLTQPEIVPAPQGDRPGMLPAPQAPPGSSAPPGAPVVRPLPGPPPVLPPARDGMLAGPMLSESGTPGILPPAVPTQNDRPLAINLATALRLSNGRPLVIAAAQARVQIAAAQTERANALWLPNIVGGGDYIRHAGGNQAVNGDLINQSTNFFYGGGSAEVRFATSDAVFEPLAARQVLQSRRIETQKARNEALRDTAEAYFSVQMARGTYASMVDSTNKATELVRRVTGLAGGLVAPDEVDRARTILASLEQSTQQARQQWRVSSATLTRVLRLDPSAVVVPQEPDHLQITLFPPQEPVDDLIILGLRNRPELASQQALVRATLVRLRHEKLRPLMPSILITGNGTPDFLYQGGIFGTGSGNSLNQWAGRADVSAQMVWRLENLGFGYQARVREQRGEVQLANIEFFKVQDDIAAQVAQAKADVDSAALRVLQADDGLKQALSTFVGNLKGMGQTQRFGDVLSLVNRPQEVVASLQQLQTAYINYYTTVGEFNRAQFRLFYAVGFPAEELACNRPTGPIEPVNSYRGPALPNVPVR